MSSNKFHPTRSIAARQPPPSSSVAASATTTSAFLHPPESKWWSYNYALHGPKSTTTNVSASSKCTNLTTPTPSGCTNVSSIDFSPTPADTTVIAVASGPRVLLYNATAGGSTAALGTLSRALLSKSSTGQVAPDKTLPSPAPVYAISYRPDGRLLAYGGAGGTLRLCDTSTRSVLRTFGSGRTAATASVYARITGAVRTVTWLRDGRHLLAGGDDAVVRMYDVSNQDGNPVGILRGHGDGVRAMVLLSVGAGKKKREVLVTGSYDHTIRCWDVSRMLDEVRRDGSAKTVDCSESCLLSIVSHGAPVEALLHIPNTKQGGGQTVIASAGGTTIKLWDIATGIVLRTNDASHAKTVTDLCLADNCGAGSTGSPPHQRRIVSVGLDGFLRVYDVDTLQCLHGHKFASPLLSIAMSNPPPPSSSSNRRRGRSIMVVGTEDGTISFRQRPPLAAKKSPTAAKPQPRAGTYKFFMRGGNATPDPDDYAVVLRERRRLQSFDKSLKAFRYGDALDEALATKDPQSVSAVLEELAKRRTGLEIALSNRDEESLEPILAFTVRYIAQPRYSPLLVGVAGMLCDVYGPVVGQSAVIDELFEKLRRHVKGEVRVQRSMLRLLGQIDAVVCAAELLQS